MRAVIFYATRGGQTRPVAEHVATELRLRAYEVELYGVGTETGSIDWSANDWACVMASVHAGHHEVEMIEFIKRHRQGLERLRAAFLSVTLSEAGAEDIRAPKERREQAAAGAPRIIDLVEQETGWRPAHALPVAVALADNRYNFITRFVDPIARLAASPTDAWRDYEFTDRSTVDAFVGVVTAAVDGAPDTEAMRSRSEPIVTALERRSAVDVALFGVSVTGHGVP